MTLVFRFDSSTAPQSFAQRVDGGMLRKIRRLMPT
jgi:hypothetical protein